MAIVSSTLISQNDLLDLINVLKAKDFCYIRSKVDRIEFKRFDGVFNADDLWENGRLFNEEFEIRWQFENLQYKVTLLTENNDPSIVFENIENGWDTRETKIKLWGKYKRYKRSDGFLEVKIPGILKYPTSENGQWKEENEAEIHALNYMRQGITLFTRFIKVEVVKK